MVQATLNEIGQAIESLLANIGDYLPSGVVFLAQEFTGISKKQLDELVESSIDPPEPTTASLAEIEDALIAIEQAKGEAPPEEDLDGISKEDLDKLVESIVNPPEPKPEPDPPLPVATPAEIRIAVAEMNEVIGEEELNPIDFEGITKLDLNISVIKAKITKGVSEREKAKNERQAREDLIGGTINDLQNGDAFTMVPLTVTDPKDKGKPQMHVLLAKIQQLMLGIAVNVKTGTPTQVSIADPVKKVEGLPGVVFLPVLASPILPVPPEAFPPDGFVINPSPAPDFDDPPWPDNTIIDGTNGWSLGCVEGEDVTNVREILEPADKDEDYYNTSLASEELREAAAAAIQRSTTGTGIGRDQRGFRPDVKSLEEKPIVTADDLEGLSEKDLRKLTKDITGKPLIQTQELNKPVIEGTEALTERLIDTEVLFSELKKADSSIKEKEDAIGRTIMFFVSGFPVGDTKIKEVKKIRRRGKEREYALIEGSVAPLTNDETLKDEKGNSLMYGRIEMALMAVIEGEEILNAIDRININVFDQEVGITKKYIEAAKNFIETNKKVKAGNSLRTAVNKLIEQNSKLDIQLNVIANEINNYGKKEFKQAKKLKLANDKLVMELSARLPKKDDPINSSDFEFVFEKVNAIVENIKSGIKLALDSWAKSLESPQE